MTNTLRIPESHRSQCLNKRVFHHISEMTANNPQNVHHLVELALRDAVAVVDDSGGLESGGLVKLNEQLPHHGGQVLNDVLTVLLHPHCGTVSAGMGIHTTNNLKQKYNY